MSIYFDKKNTMKNMTVKTDKRVTYQKVAEISKTPGRNVILETKVA